MRDSAQNPTLEQAVIDAANQAESKTQQAEAVAKMVDVIAAQNKAVIRQSVSAAVDAAAEKAKEVQIILGAWGDDAGTMEKKRGEHRASSKGSAESHAVGDLKAPWQVS